MSVCNTFSKNVASRKCLVPGGLKTRAWIFQQADFTGAQTFATNGALSSFALATGAQVISCTGRAKKGSGSSKITKAEDAAVSVEQSVVVELAYGTQHELDAIMDLLRADGKTIFVETNSGQIRQYFQDYGDATLDAEEGTGTVIGDASNVVKATIKGTESVIPRFFEAVITGQQTQLAASRAYLDALVTSVAVTD